MSKMIPLTQGKFAIVDDADYEWLSRWKWYALKNGRTFYALRHQPQDNGKQGTIQMHRQILGTPAGMETDHVAGNGLDNRRANLRACTHRQNQRNSKKRQGCSSSYKGVSWDKQRGRWRALICTDGLLTHLGRFANEAEAARAYNAEALERFGAFAKLNVIQEASC